MLGLVSSPPLAPPDAVPDTAFKDPVAVLVLVLETGEQPPSQNRLGRWGWGLLAITVACLLFS